MCIDMNEPVIEKIVDVVEKFDDIMDAALEAGRVRDSGDEYVREAYSYSDTPPDDDDDVLDGNGTYEYDSVSDSYRKI